MQNPNCLAVLHFNVYLVATSAEQLNLVYLGAE